MVIMTSEPRALGRSPGGARRRRGGLGAGLGGWRRLTAASLMFSRLMLAGRVLSGRKAARRMGSGRLASRPDGR
jgi:hypothetical protein